MKSKRTKPPRPSYETGNASLRNRRGSLPVSYQISDSYWFREGAALVDVAQDFIDSELLRLSFIYKPPASLPLHLPPRNHHRQLPYRLDCQKVSECTHLPQIVFCNPHARCPRWSFPPSTSCRGMPPTQGVPWCFRPARIRYKR